MSLLFARYAQRMTNALGNQTSRTVGGVAYTQTFDYDNRLTGVAGGSVSATFLYDAAGNRVKGTIAGVTTVYVAGLYEYQNGAVTKYTKAEPCGAPVTRPTTACSTW